MRVASTLPAATEILFELGVEPVAVSHECDHPPTAREKPSITVSRVDGCGNSAAINDGVHRALQSGEGVYEIDRNRLRAASPDLIVAQAVCEVCAVDSVTVERALETMDVAPETLTVDAHRLSEILADVDKIGRAVDRSAAADELVTTFQDRIENVRRRGGSGTIRPRVVILDWMDPVMVAGHWCPELVEIAGGAYDLASAGDRSLPRRWEEIIEYDPEIIMVAPCGFDLDQTRENIGELIDRPGWEDISAVESNEVYTMDGSQFVNRPGPRVIETLEYIAAIISPESYPSPPESAVERVSSGWVD